MMATRHLITGATGATGGEVVRLLLDAGQTKLVVPRPHPELVTRRVLVMEKHAQNI